MVTKAFQIYNNLDETQRNEFVIQSLLTCCKIMQNKKPMDTMKVVNHIKNSIINTHNNVNSKNLLMGIYLRCNDIMNVMKLFDSIPTHKKDIKSIKFIMNACNKNKEYNKTIVVYEQYSGEHDDITNVLFIKACSNIGQYKKAKALINSHTTDINCHSIEFINTLMNLYGKTGDINYALNIFNNMPVNKRNMTSVNTIMNIYVKSKQYSKAIAMYEQTDGTYTDISNVLYIKACVNIGEYDKVKQLINSNIKDVNSHSIELITSLVDFYGKIGDINNALYIFNNIPQKNKDITTISAMMNGCNNNGQYDKTILLYEEYNGNHNDVSRMVFIKACINMGYYEKAKTLINSVIKDVNDINYHSSEFINTLIDFYGKTFDVNSALNIFNNITKKK
eukprot:370816_1